VHVAHQTQNKQHIPVLLDAVLKYLKPSSGESYLDLTAGYGGHAQAILERTGSLTHAVLVDRDEEAVSSLRRLFGDKKTDIRQADFLSASLDLAADGRRFDLVLADLGVSSPHLDIISRGFSWQGDGPLDMRMDQAQTLTAATIVNTYSESRLSDILVRFGEEPKARQIARAIVRQRPIQSAEQLAAIARTAWPGYSRVHPATRTFQAVRIAVNDELTQLEKAIPLWIEMLQPGGRLAVIGFHSLEDRIVKKAFQEAAGNRYDAELRILTKHPVTADHQELVLNPRARSAKLRAAVKTKT
jgi:16S rRNA (cytosine1402-N4)-methyltransferase